MRPTEGVGDHPKRTVRLSTAYSGGFAVARPGAMFRPSTAIGTRSIGGSGGGVKPGYGRQCRSRWPRSWRTAATTASIAPRFAPMSRQRVEKGDSSKSSWPPTIDEIGGGFTSKLHCLADRRGRPLAFHLTVGEAADCKAYDTLIALPERVPQAFLADKGYDADAIRADLANRNIEAVIPGRSNRRVKIEYDRSLYKERNKIERFFGHLKINRAIATRYDQLAESFLSMVHIASAKYWLKFVHAA